MNNSKLDLLKWINSLETESLRKVTYLLCSPNLKNESISSDIHYQEFIPKEGGQFGLDYYDQLDVHDLKALESISTATALGRYAERLLAAWFNLNPNFDLLANNLQLVKAKETVGEIDFLLWEKQAEKAVHAEFALKYYLAHTENGQQLFTGPKGRDTFARKAKKLTEHQLLLSSEYHNLLPSSVREFTFESRLILKGVLFYPFDTNRTGDLWLKYSERVKLEKLNDFQFYLLPKRKDWIFPFDKNLKIAAVTPSNMSREIETYQDRLPLMISYENEKTGELARMIIVADSWPNID